MVVISSYYAWMNDRHLFQPFLTSLNSSRYRSFLSSSDNHLLLLYARHYWKDTVFNSVSVHRHLWFWTSPAVLLFHPIISKIWNYLENSWLWPSSIFSFLFYSLPFSGALHIDSFNHNGLNILPDSIIVVIPLWPDWESISTQWCQLTFISLVIILIFYPLWN